MTSSSLRRVMHLLLAATATEAALACGGGVVSVNDGQTPGGEGQGQDPPAIGTVVPEQDPPDSSVPDRFVSDAPFDRSYPQTCVNGVIDFDPAFCCADPTSPKCNLGGGGDEACKLDCSAICAVVAPGLDPFGGCYYAKSDGGVKVSYLCGSCGVGRVPAGTAACPRGGSVAERLAMQAYYEAASVDAFVRVAELLEREGAPSALVERAMKAARDERRHARLFESLARARGMRSPQPREAPSFASLFDLALENAREGQVRETYGALVALHQSRHAVDGDLRAAFAAVADDEIAHAALSWDLARWLESRLTPAERAQVDAAHAEARDTLRDLATRDHDEVDHELGMPSPAVGRTLFDQLFRDLAVAA